VTLQIIEALLPIADCKQTARKAPKLRPKRDPHPLNPHISLHHWDLAMEYHAVPLEERARDEKGNILPWGYVFKE
jgi:hypothetical protein